jgi:hypothetical protein
MRLIQPLRNARTRLGLIPAETVTRVEIVQPDAELVAALQVVDEARVRLGRLVGVRLREVDEVAPVREDVQGRVVGVGGCELAVLLGDVGGEGGVVPFSLGFEEEGEGVGADVQGVLDRVLYAW